KLAKEGLFDPGRKKPLPSFPLSIAVITSPTGAAIRDVIRMTEAISRCVKILVLPVRVQGEGSAAEIADAIELVNVLGGFDVILLTRGGGSIEDLWAFNEELVARAIAKSTIPVVSAVGHETDFTISDMVADLRAPTPSSAPGLILKEYVDAKQKISSMISRARVSILNALERHEDTLKKATTRYALMRIEDMLFQNARELDQATSSAVRAINLLIEKRSQELALFLSKVEALSPQATLKRGFSICFLLPDMKVVRDASDLKIGMRIATRFYSGSAESRVEQVKEG
ncbi:MAG: exodeoxyribonuclease VII large subunit, partial [bacterium]